ncbi:MAG: hypothetical protein IJ587_00690 [Synergistaceae bacterium]|nr:hypothetical protein [Synergistaceae bacterium]
MKAKTIDRVALTQKKMDMAKAFHEAMKHSDEVPAAPGAEEHPEPAFDEYHCPYCGGELMRYEGCYRCKKCGWSKC